jgi:integrase
VIDVPKGGRTREVPLPLKAVQELLGHATIEMTMRYAHLAPDVSREAVKLLDAPAPPAPASGAA